MITAAKSAMTSLLLACSLWTLPSLAQGLPPSDEPAETARVQVLDAPAISCPSRQLCLSAGAPATLLAPSGPSNIPGAQKVDSSLAQFTRTVKVAGLRSSARLDESVPWVIDLNATTRHPALAGNALFLIYDAEDHQAMKMHEVTAAWQVPIRAGDQLAARMTFNPDEGFRANHTYMIRVVQIVQGREVLLTKGKFRLS